jgi:Zn-finger nucleic acid-binding protein
MDLTCPKCHAPMRQYERNGVTVDQCTDCRGLFLDRGELEKLTAAENAWHGEGQQRAPQREPSSPPQYQPPQPYQQPHYQQPYYQKKKKRSFLEDLFD